MTHQSVSIVEIALVSQFNQIESNPDIQKQYTVYIISETEEWDQQDFRIFAV